jgi:phage tail sheath gpL-like
MAFQFTGLDPTYKVPKFIGKIVFSAGALSASDLPLYVLYIGPKTSAGSLTADQDIVEVFDEEEIDSKVGARSLLGWMARKGLRAAPTSRHFVAPYANPGGATAATVTMLLAGTPTGSGEWIIRIAGIEYRGVITSTSTVDAIGADMETKIQADARCPFTAVYVSGTDTLTLTCANVGDVGKDWIIQVDKSRLAPGVTITVTGSAALGGDRVRAGAGGTGVGTADVTTLLTKLLNQRYARIASSTNEAVNVALLETHVNTKADMLTLKLEQLVYGFSGTLPSSQTLATVTMNHQRAQLLWMRNADIHPAVVAAVKAAVRATTEGADPVPDYDGLLLPGIPPHAWADDAPLDSEQNAALNSGVTPITSYNGEAHVVRSITSYSLLGGVGGTPDFRTIDIGDAVMTDYAMLDLKLLYETEFRPGNKYVRADPLPGEADPPVNVGYPRLWNTAVYARMKAWFNSGWIENPDANPPQSQFNKPAKAIESLVPLVVSRVQHQIRQIVRQTGP